MTWQCMAFPSGTQIVTRQLKDEPHYYVYGPYTGDDSESTRNRYKVSEDLCAWLNGGPRPVWMDDMERTSETCIESCDGTRIYATGPVYDRNPPALDWWQCDDQESRDKRARLIDRLMGLSAGEGEGKS